MPGSETVRIVLGPRQKAILLELASGKAVLSTGAFRMLTQHVAQGVRWTQVYLEPLTVTILRDRLGLIRVLDVTHYPPQLHYGGTFARLTDRGWEAARQAVMSRPGKHVFYL